MKFIIHTVYDKVGVVAPLAGAWIEIFVDDNWDYEDAVAPLAGAWIEIAITGFCFWMIERRSPRGSVD